MAAAVNPVGNALLVPLVPHEVPQHAYAADPGTITGWIVANERGVPLLAELSYVWNVMNHFYNMPDDRASQVCQDQVADMVHSVLGDDSLCPFLTVTTFEGQEAVVSVMTRIGKYVGRLGDQAGYLHGKTLGNLGEFDAATGRRYDGWGASPKYYYCTPGS
jgi:hypothetical protein